MKWKTQKLETFCSIVKGKKHEETAKGSGAYRYLQIDDIHTGLDLKYTNGEGAEAEPTDVLIAWDGANAGKVGVGLNGMIGSTLARLRPNQKVVNSSYLYRYLDSNFETIKRQRTGATIPHVNASSLRSMEIPLPPLHIQQQIADTLDKADALRQKDQQLLQKYDELGLSIFYEMFGHPDLYQSRWEMHNLEDLCTNIVDCPHTTPNHTTTVTEFPCIRTSELRDGEIRWDTMKYLQEEEYGVRIARLKPEHGDIVYGREGTFGEAVMVPKKCKMSLGQRTMLFRPNQKLVSPVFLWFQVRSPFVYQQALRKNTGSTVGHVNIADIRKFQIFVPSLDLQKKFGERISTVRKLKEQIINTADKSQEVFDAIMKQHY